MGCKVLLLEKSEAISKNIFLILSESGFEVLSTNSITEGLYILSEYKIGIIIADINIDNGKIIYFAEEVNLDNKYSSIPLLILADEIGKNTWRETDGIKNWLIRPFSANKLLKTVKKLSV